VHRGHHGNGRGSCVEARDPLFVAPRRPSPTEAQAFRIASVQQAARWHVVC
jgi:hypothetical protein